MIESVQELHERFRDSVDVALGNIPFVKRLFAHRSASRLRGNSPRYCVVAGDTWGDKEFYEHQFTLVQGISVNPQECVEAGKRWNDERFAAHAHTIVDMVTQVPDFAAEAGGSWKKDRFELFRDELAKSVLQSAEASYKAFLLWEKGKKGEFRDAIISKACSEPELCYAIESELRNPVIINDPQDFTDKIASGLSKSLQYSFKARRDWKREYFWMIEAYFPENSNGKLVSDIPEPVWEKLLQAEGYSFNSSNTELFYGNLPAVLKGENVEQWVDTILGHFKENVIGGDTYRIA
jgi:hypothetical protein